MKHYVASFVTQHPVNSARCDFVGEKNDWLISLASVYEAILQSSHLTSSPAKVRLDRHLSKT